jgi:hypothetical protein
MASWLSRFTCVVWLALLLASVSVIGADAKETTVRGPEVLTARAVTQAFRREGIPLSAHVTTPLRSPFHGATYVATAKTDHPFVDRYGFAVDAWVFPKLAEAKAYYALVYAGTNDGSGGFRGVRVRNVIIDVYAIADGQVDVAATMKRFPTAVVRALASLGVGSAG